MAWDEYGNYLGKIGDDREVFMPIPFEFLFDAGLHYAEGEGIPPDLLRAAGLGSYVDGFQAEDDENDADSDPRAVPFGASGSDVAAWVEDTDMSGVNPSNHSAEENEGNDDSNATTHSNENNMDRYYYGNMDGAMDDFEDHTAKVEVAETETIASAIPNEATESDESPPKPFDFFGRLSGELRDMIYGQLLEEKVHLNDNFDGMFGARNKLRVTITKPLVPLCLVNKQFSSEYIRVCEDRKKLSIRTSQFVHQNGDTNECYSLGGRLEQVKFLEFHLGDWALQETEDAVTRFSRRHDPYDPVAESQRALADLETFKRWLTDLCSHTSRLRTISLKMYVQDLRFIGNDVFEGWLRSMASLERLEQLKVVKIEDSPIREPLCWDLRAKHQLLLLWKAGDLMPPTIMNPTTEYAESCCEELYHGSRQWDEDPDWDYDGNYIGDDETFPMGRTFY